MLSEETRVKTDRGRNGGKMIEVMRVIFSMPVNVVKSLGLMFVTLSYGVIFLCELCDVFPFMY